MSVERCFVNAKVTCAESTMQIDGMIIAVRAIRDNNKMICEDSKYKWKLKGSSYASINPS